MMGEERKKNIQWTDRKREKRGRPIHTVSFNDSVFLFRYFLQNDKEVCWFCLLSQTLSSTLNADVFSVVVLGNLQAWQVVFTSQMFTHNTFCMCILTAASYLESILVGDYICECGESAVVANNTRVPFFVRRKLSYPESNLYDLRVLKSSSPNLQCSFLTVNWIMTKTC